MPAIGNQLRNNGDGNLLRSGCADVDPNRRVSAPELVDRCTLLLELLTDGQHPCASNRSCQRSARLYRLPNRRRACR
jgi:hypothetical protein